MSHLSAEEDLDGGIENDCGDVGDYLEQLASRELPDEHVRRARVDPAPGRRLQARVRPEHTHRQRHDRHDTWGGEHHSAVDSMVPQKKQQHKHCIIVLTHTHGVASKNIY